LNVPRMVVASLLIGSVAAGFTYGPPLDKALAAVTSYSTWTSTYYSSWYSTSYSIQYGSTTVITTEILSQDRLAGPYLKITRTIGANSPYTATFDMRITNLMDVPVLSGTIFLEFEMSGGSTRSAQHDFGAIEPGDSIRVEGTIGVPAGVGQTRALPTIFSFA